MDALQEFLESLERLGLAQGHTLGVFNVLIGRRIAREDGTILSNGLTWRELAAWLKKVRWDRDTVTELGLNPDDLPPRDRQQFWYAAIARAGVDSDKATQAGDKVADRLRKAGYVVGGSPGSQK
ncbi:MAG TPA: hypothetical protein VEL76_21020 [Gemmataceae bacterium]|nr:hypothetical protein [Gemmataceae bacterium]